MLSRGYIIGKIIDDITSLKSQLEIRGKFGQFDLNRFSEDFFKEVINIVYGYNLYNLNQNRSNVPGIDLGDEKNKIAIQITSQKDSGKLNDTLRAITDEQLERFTQLYIFIIGQKQGRYTIHEDNKEKQAILNFDIEKNILDLDSLLREIVILDVEKLDNLYDLFRREFRQVKIEFEPIDKEGNFESSYFNRIEAVPSMPPVNSKKYLIEYLGLDADEYDTDHKKIVDLYNRLSFIPRVTRELLIIIYERGKYVEDSGHGARYKILPSMLEKILKISEKELLTEFQILQFESLVSLNEGFIDEQKVYFFEITDQVLVSLLHYSKEMNITLRTMLNTMDFSILDK